MVSSLSCLRLASQTVRIALGRPSRYVIPGPDLGDPALIEREGKALENTVKQMAKDIRDKYLDPPNTTDFAIMFLPFENIYAEIIRRAGFVDTLVRDYKIVITGPTTFAAILNSLQMGFRTLAIQKRSGEVWEVLKAVKTEFANFSSVLESAQKNLLKANGRGILFMRSFMDEVDIRRREPAGTEVTLVKYVVSK